MPRKIRNDFPRDANSGYLIPHIPYSKKVIALLTRGLPALRKANGELNLSRLPKAVNLSVSTVHRILQGKTPGPRAAQRIIEASADQCLTSGEGRPLTEADLAYEDHREPTTGLARSPLQELLSRGLPDLLNSRGVISTSKLAKATGSVRQNVDRWCRPDVNRVTRRVAMRLVELSENQTTGGPDFKPLVLADFLPFVL